MTDIFIDTDVIIDFLIDREPHSREAAYYLYPDRTKEAQRICFIA